jgi:uncharacterized protein (TIGR02145 family)
MRRILTLVFLMISYIEGFSAVNLVITGAVVPTGMFQGKSYAVSYTVKNIGSTSTSTSFVVSVWISGSSTFSTSTATYLTEFNVSGGLAANSSKTVSGTITVPATYGTGTKYIIGGVDGGSAVTESNEADNNFPLSVLIRQCPLTTPSGLSPGGSSSTPTSITSTTPTLQWTAVQYATCYGVYIKNNATNALIYSNDAATTTTSFTVPSNLLVAGGSYRWNIIAKSECGSSACLSAYAPAVYFNVASPCTTPATPGNPTHNSPQTGEVTLTRSGSPPTGETWYWQGTSCGTSTSLGSGATYTATASGTYYIRSKNSCGTWSGCGSATVTVQSAPATPPNPTSNSPQTGSVTITRSGTPPSGETWYWQGTSCGTNTSLGSGTTFTATASGTYYLRARNTSGTWSTSCGVVSVTVNTDAGTPANPPNPTSNSPQQSSVIITRTGTPPAGETWYWQGTSCGTNTNLGSGSTFTATASGDYFIRARNSSNVWSNGCGQVNVTVGTCVTPALPVSLAASATATSATLSWNSGNPAGSSPVTYYWAVGTSSNITYESGYSARGTTQSNTALATSLNPATNYFWTVKAVTGCDNSTSGYTTPLQFTTSISPQSISGYVKDVKVNHTARNIELINYAGCNITAYHAGTATIAGSTTSSSTGAFQINVPTSGLYDIKATDNSSPINTVRINNVAANGAAQTIKIPNTILLQIKSIKNKLVNLKPSIYSLGSSLVSVSHNMASHDALTNQWKNITSNHDEIDEAGSRLYLADSVLRCFYINADKLSFELSANIYEIAKTIFSVIKIFKKVTESMNINGFQLFINSTNNIRDLVIDKIQRSIEGSMAFSATESFALKTFIISQLERFKLGAFGEETFLHLIRPIVENITAAYTIKQEYIQPVTGRVPSSQFSLNMATANASSLNFSGNYTTDFSSTRMRIIEAETAAELARIKSELHRDYSEIVSRASDWFGTLSTFANAFYLSHVAAVLRGIAFGGNLWSFVELGISTSTARNAFLKNRGLLHPAVTSAFRGSQTQSVYSNISTASLEAAIIEYNQFLDTLKGDVINGDIATLQRKYSEATNKNSKLALQLKKSFVPLISTSEEGQKNSSNFDSVLYTKFPITLNSQPKAELNFNLTYLTFLLDTTSTVTKDSLFSFISTLIINNGAIKKEFDSAYSLIIGLPSYNYLENVSSDVPVALVKGSSKTVKLKFRNVGPGSCANVYAKLYVDSPFVFQTDSIFIGNLAVGQIDSISFVIHAPSVDTISSYSIQFFSDNLLSESFSGALKATSVPAAPTISGGNDGFVCDGDTLRLFCTSISNAQYNWSGPNGFASTLQNPIIPHANQQHSGIYSCKMIIDELQGPAANVAVVVNANIFKTSVGGVWNHPSTWLCGSIPGIEDSVVISAGHNLLLNSSTHIRRLSIEQNASLQLSDSSVTLTVGVDSLKNSPVFCYGSLKLSKGTLKINGSLSLMNKSSFELDGAQLIIDGNSGVDETSVPDGQNLLNVYTVPRNFKFTSGTIQIIDPPLGANSQAINCPFNFSDGGTLLLGNGISNVSSNNTNGFGGVSFPPSIGNLIVNTNPKSVNSFFKTVRKLNATSGKVIAGEVIQSAPLVIDSATLKYVKDIDNNSYPVVDICGKKWMSQNLDVAHYRNGDTIPQVQNAAAWSNLTTGAWCYYSYNSANGISYGKLYNWYAVNDPRGLAPAGWHIPSQAEWLSLIDTCLGGLSIAGGKLKSRGTLSTATGLWNGVSNSSTNSSYFSALPGGVCLENGSFVNLNGAAFWWTGSQTNNTSARFIEVDQGLDEVSQGSISKRSGLSVRCIENN